jgi:hypothetical protein
MRVVDSLTRRSPCKRLHSSQRHRYHRDEAHTHPLSRPCLFRLTKLLDEEAVSRPSLSTENQVDYLPCWTRPSKRPRDLSIVGCCTRPVSRVAPKDGAECDGYYFPEGAIINSSLDSFIVIQMCLQIPRREFLCFNRPWTLFLQQKH